MVFAMGDFQEILEAELGHDSRIRHLPPCSWVGSGRCYTFVLLGVGCTAWTSVTCDDGAVTGGGQGELSLV